MRPRLTNTKLFLDGGDPKETEKAEDMLQEAGYSGLDGQTTNPSLVAKNPNIQNRIADGKLLTRQELLGAYEEIVQEITRIISHDLSIEVYANVCCTTPEEMISQARNMAAWSPAAVIKLPITTAGLIAASELKSEVRLNMTLCFSLSQAAAVHAATRGSRYPVYVSPFIGRLDDKGENGMDLVSNIIQMKHRSDSHIEVLAASIRSVDHIREVLRLGSDAATIGFSSAFKPWAEAGFSLADESFSYTSIGNPIPYEEFDLSADWQSFDIHHKMTDAGLKRFAEDWEALLLPEERPSQSA